MKSFKFPVVAIAILLSLITSVFTDEQGGFHIVPLTGDKGPKPEGTVNSVAHCSKGGTAGTWRMEGCSGGKEKCRIEGSEKGRAIMLEFVPSAVYDSLTAIYSISDKGGSGGTHDLGPVSNSSVKANVPYAVRGVIKIGKGYAGRTISLEFVMKSSDVKVICVKGMFEVY